MVCGEVMMYGTRDKGLKAVTVSTEVCIGSLITVILCGDWHRMEE